ncbi:MAG: cohesin domain-containing protein [bacterium]|nr:cohesin domain-containing protein [bacterium]
MKRFVLPLVCSVILLSLGLFQPVLASGSFFLSPPSRTITVGTQFSMTVVVGTDGQAINSGEGTLTYPTDLLEVKHISKDGSIFGIWPVEGNATGGVISFAGGLPTPGYTGNGGNIMTVDFLALSPGTATVQVTSGRLLLNDGNGTNILSGHGTAKYTIQSAPATPEAPGEPAVVPSEPEIPPVAPLPAPKIYSSTHPVEGLWYADMGPSLSWDALEGATGFSYAFDDQSDTIPDNTSEGLENSRVYPGAGNGIWYFHVKVQNEGGWSETGHFQIRIDTIPPEQFTIRLEADHPTSQRTPQINFKTTDDLSGIDHYELSLNDSDPTYLLSTETDPYTLPFLDEGPHMVKVTAYDRAGNFRESAMSFEIQLRSADSGFFIGGYFILYFWVSIALLILILLILLLFLFLCCSRRRNNDQNRQPHQS